MIHIAKVYSKNTGAVVEVKGSLADIKAGIAPYITSYEYVIKYSMDVA